MEADTERMLNGEEPLPPSSSRNYIGELPEKFTKWLDKNSERIENAKSLPYFLADNQGLINGATASANDTGPATRLYAETEFRKFGKNVPDWEYVADDQSMSSCDRLAAVVDNYEHYYGTDNTFLDSARTAVKNGDEAAAAKWLSKLRDDIDLMNGSANPNFKCIDHLMELRNVSVESIPKQWREVFSSVMQSLNSHNFAKNGYGVVYNKIEEAYNIYKLSNDEIVKSMGYENLSHKTPYNLFSEFIKKDPEWKNALPDKAFFDKLDKFYPLTTDKAGAWFDKTNKYVNISLSDTDKNPYSRRALITHEFGHAVADGLELWRKADVKKVYDDWKAEIAKDNGRALEAAIKKKMSDFDNDWKKKIGDLKGEMRNAYDDDDYITGEKIGNQIMEMEKNKPIVKKTEKLQLGKLSDCLQAAIDGDRRIPPFGHDYFSNYENQMSEFLAHCSENYWTGNPIFEELAPDIYKKMQEIIRRRIVK